MVKLDDGWAERQMYELKIAELQEDEALYRDVLWMLMGLLSEVLMFLFAIIWMLS